MITTSGVAPTVAKAVGDPSAATYRRNGYWSDDVLTDHLDRWAEQVPDRIFIIDGDVTVSWRQLRERAYRTAASLRTLGIGRGDRVAVQLPNWREFAVVYLALARLGAVLVPAMSIYRQNELRHMLALTEPRALVVTPSFRGFDHLSMARRLVRDQPSIEQLVIVRSDGTELAPGEVTLDELEAGSGLPDASRLGPPAQADDGHIIGFTSGTEAGAKGCLHTWNTYSYTPRTQAQLYRFGPDDRELVPSPITHTAGLAGGFLKPLLAGGSVCFMDVWDPPTALALIDRHRCTQATGATAFIASLMQEYDPTRHDGSSLRYFICGGAPVPEVMVRRVRRRLPTCRLIPCFGQTEGLLITSCTLDDTDENVVSSDGRPIPGVDVEIRGEQDAPVPAGTEGQIVYRGPATMVEYWRNPEATAAIRTADGWQRTGDLGRVGADGYLRVTGRVKEMIIRGGLNISTREIEELLVQHPAVAAVAVVGLPDPILGERACAFVVPAGEPPTLAELVHFLLNEHQLAKPKLPERLEIIDALPMTLTGKVQRFALRELALASAPGKPR